MTSRFIKDMPIIKQQLDLKEIARRVINSSFDLDDVGHVTAVECTIFTVEDKKHYRNVVRVAYDQDEDRVVAKVISKTEDQ